MRLQLASESIRKKHLTVAVQIGLIMSISQLAYAETTYTEDSLSTSETENAETAIPSTTLDAITVYADSYRSTGTKTALDPEDAPMSYTRIDQDLLKRQADSVSAALRYEPGVSSESRGTVTIFDENRVRGFKTLSNFYDGLRLPYDGAWNLMPQVDVYATEAVEVVKGSASSLYGYTAPGGMVNQIAKTPQSTQETEVQLRLGNQDLKEVGIDTTGALTDSLNYRFCGIKAQKRRTNANHRRRAHAD